MTELDRLPGSLNTPYICSVEIDLERVGVNPGYHCALQPDTDITLISRTAAPDPSRVVFAVAGRMERSFEVGWLRSSFGRCHVFRQREDDGMKSGLEGDWGRQSVGQRRKDGRASESLRPK